MSWVVLAPVLVPVPPPDEHRPPAQVPGPGQDGAGPPGGVAVEHLSRSQLRLVPHAVDQVPGRHPGQHRPGPGHRWRVPAEPRLSVPHLADDNIFEFLRLAWLWQSLHKFVLVVATTTIREAGPGWVVRPGTGRSQVELGQAPGLGWLRFGGLGAAGPGRQVAGQL